MSNNAEVNSDETLNETNVSSVDDLSTSIEQYRLQKSIRTSHETSIDNNTQCSEHAIPKRKPTYYYSFRKKQRTVMDENEKNKRCSFGYCKELFDESINEYQLPDVDKGERRLKPLPTHRRLSKLFTTLDPYHFGSKYSYMLKRNQ
ncbi:hypothetical protein CHUAL_002153 [Chamberlinius hualienensis]